CYFYGTKGILHLGWTDGWTFYPQNKGGSKIHVKPTLHEPDAQNIRELWADFLDAIETGRRPVCDIEIAHRSTNMSLLAMMSYKLGRSIAWDGEKEECPGDAEANALLGREYRGDWGAMLG
ncbi:MAG: gfo/Idh/MocA family oxidoreductase, partial [Verrucomicrobiales bacterium]